MVKRWASRELGIWVYAVRSAEQSVVSKGSANLINHMVPSAKLARADVRVSLSASFLLTRPP